MSAWDKLLDATVVRSFDRSGFERHARSFVPRDMEVSLAGKVAWITGANSGLGLATAHVLGRLGARTVLLCRDAARGDAARAQLEREDPSGHYELAQLDVSNLAAVFELAQTRTEKVDLLIHNAGVLPLTLQQTPEGHERTFATNVLGQFALTCALLDRLRATSGRVITVSSGGMYPVRLSLAALQGNATRFDGVAAYAQTKRAEIILNELWAARVPEIRFHAMHPGWADTPGVSSSLPRFHAWMRRALRSPQQGADTVAWLAAAEKPGMSSGGFWFDRAPAPAHVFPWTHETPDDRDALWALCERLTRTTPTSPAS